MAIAAMNGKGIPAKFAGVCPVCNGEIRVNKDRIVRYDIGVKRRWRHVECNGKPKASEPPPKPKPAAKPKPAPATPKAKGKHPAFADVLTLAKARMPVFLPGPAGCGKTHLAKQVANELGMEFSSVSCTVGMSEAQLTGRSLPMGESGAFAYVETPFVRRYENGGVFLFDEIDAADPNVMLIVNSAIANGEMSLPARHENPVAHRNPDFVCIAAANTFGRGADRLYVGRNQLDESTLDRFRVGTVPMDYDEELEKELCPDGNLLSAVWTYRRRARENRLERIVSTRFALDAYKMMQAGWSQEKALGKLFEGWREDEVRKVREGR